MDKRETLEVALIINAVLYVLLWLSLGMPTSVDYFTRSLAYFTGTTILTFLSFWFFFNNILSSLSSRMG